MVITRAAPERTLLRVRLAHGCALCCRTILSGQQAFRFVPPVGRPRYYHVACARYAE